MLQDTPLQNGKFKSPAAAVDALKILHDKNPGAIRELFHRAHDSEYTHTKDHRRRLIDKGFLNKGGSLNKDMRDIVKLNVKMVKNRSTVYFQYPIVIPS